MGQGVDIGKDGQILFVMLTLVRDGFMSFLKKIE